MRPKKKILIVDADDARREVKRFTLTILRFQALCAGSADEARQAAAEFRPDLVMLCWPLAGAGPLLGDLHKRYPEMPSMVVAEKLAELPEDIVPDAVLLGSGCSTSEIIDRARALMVRRRGPRKFMPGHQRSVELMETAERRIAVALALRAVLEAGGNQCAAARALGVHRNTIWRAVHATGYTPEQLKRMARSRAIAGQEKPPQRGLNSPEAAGRAEERRIA